MSKWTENNFEVVPPNVNEYMIFDGQEKIMKKQIGDKSRVHVFPLFYIPMSFMEEN